jgi:hypothetical protein
MTPQAKGLREKAEKWVSDNPLTDGYPGIAGYIAGYREALKDAARVADEVSDRAKKRKQETTHFDAKERWSNQYAAADYISQAIRQLAGEEK